MPPRKFFVLAVMCALLGVGLSYLMVRYIVPPAIPPPQVVVQQEPASSSLITPEINKPSQSPTSPPLLVLQDTPWVNDDKPPKPIYVAGIVRYRAMLRVILTDGRVYHWGDPQLQMVDSRGAIIEGNRIYMRPMFHVEQPPDGIQTLDTPPGLAPNSVKTNALKIVENMSVQVTSDG